VHDLFPKLWAGRGVQVIRLPELTARSSERLVREVLGERGSDEVVARIVERAAGNAFFLEELVRTVAEGGGDALPESVVAMVQTRLERLEPDARRVLRAASVFGQVFWRGGVQALLGETEVAQASEVDEWIRNLVDRETIAVRARSKFPGDQEYAFRHALVREGAYGMLTPEDRRLGHMLAAGWLEQAGEEEPMVLAEHLERGGELPRAVNWYRRAAQAALDGNDFDAVVARAERGVACGASEETLGALRCLQTEAHRWRGELAGAEACSLEAMRLLQKCTPLWYGAVGDLALASGRRGKTPQLVTIGELLHDLAKKRTMTAGHAIASARAATQLLLAGKHELADRLIAQVEALPKDEEDRNPSARARILVAHAYRAICSGDLGTAVERSQGAANQYERIGDVRSACVQRGDVGYAYLDLGAYEQAVSTLREVLDTAARLGRLDYTAATAKVNLGEALGRVGELEEARRIEEEAAEDFRKKGDQRMEGGARMLLAGICCLGGDLPSAEREVCAAVEMLAVAPPMRARALAMHARIKLATGHPSDALGLAEQADGILQQLGADEGDSLVPLVYAEALQATARQRDAHDTIATARQRLLERADKIRDPRLRESFLSRVSENRRTIELAREWLGETRLD
jgi:tetratricopeptide (TPR) repeat protein